MDLKPHRYKGWLNPKIEDPELFKEQVKNVCQIYKIAADIAEQGTHVFSTDEKTGIQAIEHLNPTLPMKPGQVERCEQEYIRHGTSGLIATRNIVTGEIIAPLIQPTRTEEDLIKHLRGVVAIDPKAKYIFVMDQLNTHKSESLVCFVAEQSGIDIDTLGIKGKSGVMKSMETRAIFLSDSSHKIQIVYTPKHTSWLNQIEIWFSILTRRLLNRRSNFKSIQDLEGRIAQFIEYYNEYLAKPFRWSYEGKLLKA